MTFANYFSTSAPPAPSATALDLVCPVNSMVTLRTAVDNGADWVRIDHRVLDDTAGLPGSNLGFPAIIRGIRYAHDRRCKVLLAIETHTKLSTWSNSRDAIDQAARSGVDAIALSDPALLLYAAARHSGLRLHFLVQDAIVDCNTIDFFHRRFGVSRVLLPRVVTFAQMARIAAYTPVELQVVGFGRHCSIIGGDNRVLSETRGAHACHPHPAMNACATAEQAANDSSFAHDAQPDANALKLLPQLAMLGINAIQIEAPSDGPSQLAPITRVWRAAVDECLENLDHYSVRPSWIAELSRVAKDARRR